MRGRFLLIPVLVVVLSCAPVRAAESTYTLDDVAAHAVATDCWSTVRGAVYNLTAWIAQHPHGANDILGMCGKDATGDYETEHIGSATAKAALDPYRIGYLPGAAPTPTPSPVLTAIPPAPTATKPAVTKLKTITCVKAKQVKKIKATKCPTGWKKR